MILKVIGLKDKKAGIYHNPVQALENDIMEAIRYNCYLATQEEEPDFIPADFAVYEYGTFDNCSGKYDLHDSPEHLIDCENFTFDELDFGDIDNE